MKKRLRARVGDGGGNCRRLFRNLKRSLAFNGPAVGRNAFTLAADVRIAVKGER